MNPDQNMTQEEAAALHKAMQAAQAQRATQQQNQGFTVETIVNSLEERLSQEMFMADQCANNIANLNKIIPALKAIP